MTTCVWTALMVTFDPPVPDPNPHQSEASVNLPVSVQINSNGKDSLISSLNGQCVGMMSSL